MTKEVKFMSRLCAALFWRAAITFVLIGLLPRQSLIAQWLPTGLQGGESIQCFHSLGSILFVGIGSEVYRSLDGGRNWEWSSNGLPSLDGAQSLASIGSILVAGMTYKGIYLSYDSGVSWHPSHSDSSWSPSPAFFALIEFHGYLFAGPNGSGVYRSSDSGRNWVAINNGLPIKTEPAGAYCFVAFDSLLLAGSPFGEVYRSSDDGNSWHVVKLSINKNDIVEAMAFVGHVLVAGTPRGAYRSNDLGLTWSSLDTSIFHHGIQSLIATNGYLIAGIQSTVMRSRDTGLTWYSFAQGWPSDQFCPALDTLDGYFFAGADFGGGILRRAVSDLARVTESTPSFQSFPQNSPNPFSASTTISLSPETSGYAEVSVVNLLGTEVTRLFSGELPAGEHSFTWDARGMMPGMYMGLVHANGRTERIPMMLTR